MSTVLESLRASWREVASGLPGDRAMRERALEEFLARGLPTTAEEDWKYTSLAGLEALQLAQPGEVEDAVAMAAATTHAVAELNGPRLVFVNGRLLTPACSLADNQGLTIESLGQSLRSDPGAAALDRAVDLDRYRFARLNTALFVDGARLHAARGVVAPLPVYLLFITLGEPGTTALVQPRVLIEAGEQAELTVIEHHCGEGSPAVINAVTEIVGRAGSRITHYRVQEQAAEHVQVAGLNARLERDARLTCHNIDLGGALVRNDVHVRLVAPGAEVELNGLYFSRDASHVDNHTRIDHLAPRTLSREDYRGVLDGRSRAVFNGKVLVAEDAQKIEAHQSNANLLLSGQCEVDTKPELEIYADDVKCSHGATVGQLDAMALFYLRSRGLDEPTARGLLTYAFAAEVISRLGVEALTGRLSRTVMGRLPDSERLREFA